MVILFLSAREIGRRETKVNKSHEPKTKSERRDRSIYISRRIHADKLQAKAEVADARAEVADARAEFRPTREEVRA